VKLCIHQELSFGEMGCGQQSLLGSDLFHQYIHAQKSANKRDIYGYTGVLVSSEHTGDW
jgi:hypothetical protein